MKRRGEVEEGAKAREVGGTREKRGQTGAVGMDKRGKMKREVLKNKRDKLRQLRGKRALENEGIGPTEHARQLKGKPNGTG